MDNKRFWLHWLSDYPVPQFVQRIEQYLTEGIDIGYNGHRKPVISQNWKSATEYDEHVQNFIHDNVQLGAVAGPLDQIPPDYRASPLGAFMRKCTQKVRVIHDLSWPPGDSVNDYISAADCSVNYVTVDQAANLCLLYKEPWIVKMDIKAAFLSCPVRQQDTNLLGFQFPDIQGKSRAYKFQALPFGMRSSPRRFDDLAKALLYIMIKRGVPSSTVQYLDDYCSITGSEHDARRALELMVETAELAGFRVQPDKTLGPYRSMEFLGILIDTVTGTLEISPDRMADIRSELQDWYSRPKCTKRQLLSLIGRLNFCSRVVRCGRIFMRRLIELSKKARNLHHVIKLDAQAKLDIKWWLDCMQSHNGIAWIDDSWCHSKALFLQTDASNQAASAIFGTDWVVAQFSGTNSWMLNKTIAWRELYAIVMGIATFGPYMSNQYVAMYTDNKAIQYCINSGVCKDPSIMSLIRALYLYVTRYSIRYRAFFVSTVDNGPADSLSRNQIERFRQLCPNAKLQPLKAPQVILDY